MELSIFKEALDLPFSIFKKYKKNINICSLSPTNMASSRIKPATFTCRDLEVASKLLPLVSLLSKNIV